MKNLGKMSMLVLVVLLLAVSVAPKQNNNNGGELFAPLSGFDEVPATFSTASGSFQATISPDDSSIDFELNYEGFAPGATVTAAHIHVGQVGVNGNVIVFLCGGGGRPACTSPSGSFTGTITADNTASVPGQGIEGTPAERLARLLTMIRAGEAYVNVHRTPDHAGGEIRGQIQAEENNNNN